MRDIPLTLAARLSGGATTLCHGWSLTRRDGVALGFTDHDRDLVLDGLVYAARTGLEAAEASAELGFSVGGGDVAGALTSAGIAPEDVSAGLFDGATVETWLVDWSAPEARLLMDVATIGEIRRPGRCSAPSAPTISCSRSAPTGPRSARRSPPRPPPAA